MFQVCFHKAYLQSGIVFILGLKNHVYLICFGQDQFALISKDLELAIRLHTDAQRQLDLLSSPLACETIVRICLTNITRCLLATFLTEGFAMYVNLISFLGHKTGEL